MAEEEPYPTTADAYALDGGIGEGAFAKVFLGTCNSGSHAGQQLAIKVIAFENFSITMDDIYDEVRTMKLCRHANVLPLCASFVVDSSLWLVMPLMDRGSCYHILKTLQARGFLREGEGFPEEAIAPILRQSLLAIEYLHSQSQVHRDIKAGNILLDGTGAVKLADFGVAGWLDEPGRKEIGKRETFVGTPCWMAPEVMTEGAGYNQMADIWSLGITAMELAKGGAPYQNLTPMEVLVKTMREDPPTLAVYPDTVSFKQSFSSNFTKFIDLCLKKDPTKRATATQLLSSKFIKNAKQDKLAALLTNVSPINHDGVTEEVKTESPYVPGTTWYFPGEDDTPKPSAESNVASAVRGLGLDDDEAGAGTSAPAPAPAPVDGASTSASTTAPSTAPSDGAPGAGAGTGEGAAASTASNPAPQSGLDFGTLKAEIEMPMDDEDDPA